MKPVQEPQKQTFLQKKNARQGRMWQRAYMLCLLGHAKKPYL